MDNMMDAPKAPPVPNPTFVMKSQVPTGNIELEDKKPRLKAGTLIMLVIVFTFVSIMVGTLIWILLHEATKPRNSPETAIYIAYGGRARN